MVLSDNNEPFMKNTPSEDLPDPDNEEETLDSPAQVSNPGERLRSIEMASNQKKSKKFKNEFLRILIKIKIKKDKLLPIYHKFSGTISIIFNIILLVVIVLLSKQVFSLKKLIVGDVLGGLFMNIEEMDKASISTELLVQDNILLDFPLQVNQETDLILTADTVINGARISISTGALNIISAPASIVLPAGTRLPVQFNITVPVNASVPLNLTIPLNIPFVDTELHQPFTNMQNVIEPHLNSLNDELSSWQELPACKVFGFICNWWFK